MGSIERQPSGRFVVRYRDPAGRSRKKSTRTKSEARSFLARVEADKGVGSWVDPRLGRTPFWMVADRYVHARHHLRPASLARDESLLRNHVVAFFGDMPLALIRRSDVQSFIAHEVSQGYSPRTVQECYRILAAIFADAVEDRAIRESPCRRISLPRRERRERRFLTPGETDRLAQAFPPVHRALIYTAVYLGPRWEELAALRRDRLDTERARMRIAATIERDGGRYVYVEETKSSASRRTISLPGFMATILAAHLEAAPPSLYVFPSFEGGHLRYDNFRRRVWLPAVRAAQLMPLTFHELRHTAAALMIDAGANPLQVQRRLGHTDIRTTLAEYGHLFPEADDDLNVRLERAFARATNTVSMATG